MNKNWLVITKDEFPPTRSSWFSRGGKKLFQQVTSTNDLSKISEGIYCKAVALRDEPYLES